ncbi:MAG TPA: rod shape-determining protein MreD [Acidimicrobiales bacterium]|nr:rod shape-determining protein MreD [Acidimicrobiales bacterium]
MSAAALTEVHYLGVVGRLRVAFLVFVAMAVQLTIASRLSLDGVHPDFMVLCAATAGVVAGPSRGATVGFVAGLLNDLFVPAPLGLSALSFCLVGYVVGSLHAAVLRGSWFVPAATTIAASAGGEVLYALIGAIVGQGQMISDRLGLIAGIVGGVNGLVGLVAIPAFTWAMRPPAEPRKRISRW